MITEYVAGAGTRVLEAGPSGSEEAVVFLHGVPGSADAWRPLVSAVAAELGVRAVAFDLPGFGQCTAGGPDWAYSPSAYASFVDSVLTELGVERAHLVMHDLGGVGLVWAVAHPDAFASAVIVDTGVLVDYRWHAVARLFRTPVLGRVAERAGRLGMRQVLRFYDRRVPASVLDEWIAAYDREARRALLRFYRATPASSYEVLVPALAAMDRPALVVWGRHDRFVPVEQAERQRLSFPSAEVVVLPDLGHYPHVEDPAAVTEVVLGFVRDKAGVALAHGTHSQSD